MTASISDFITWPKIDAHNHLNLGMRYASYAPWAGFYIPNFPRKIEGLADMHDNIIIPYTRPRIRTEKDVRDLIILSIKDAIADGVTILEGSIDIGFVYQCGGVEELAALTDRIVKKFAPHITFLPELGIGKTFNIDNLYKLAPPLLESGIFKSIDLYGPEVDDHIDDFKKLYKIASKLNIKRKAHIGEFSNAASILRFVELFELDEVQHGIGAASSPVIMKFLADHNIRLNICPASNEILGAVRSLKEHPIRKLLDAGINVSIGTDDLLLFNKSNSEQCADLVNAELFTISELHDLLSRNVAEYDYLK